MKVYVAASFAYEDKEKTEERKFIIKSLVDKIKVHLDADFYLPQELKIENAWDYSLSDWGRMVFEEDVKNLDESDMVLFISFGKENNAGAVWEVGYAYAKGKKVVMIKMTTNPESLMITNSAWVMMLPKDIDKIDWEKLPKLLMDVDKLS